VFDFVMRVFDIIGLFNNGRFVARRPHTNLGVSTHHLRYLPDPALPLLLYLVQCLYHCEKGSKEATVSISQGQGDSAEMRQSCKEVLSVDEGGVRLP
jgi:hypothetical protein